MYSPHTVDIFRPTYPVQNVGNPHAALPSTALKSLQGFMQPASSKDQQVYLQTGLTVSHTFYTFSDPELLLDDVIKFKGRLMFVKGMRNAIELDQAWMIDCEEWIGVQKIV